MMSTSSSASSSAKTKVRIRIKKANAQSGLQRFSRAGIESDDYIGMKRAVIVGSTKENVKE